MKLKNYQKDALDNLDKFLQIFVSHPERELHEIYKKFKDDSEDIYLRNMPGYHDVIEDVPNVCLKVPTGGGKTLIATASLKILCSYLKPDINKLIVWLVPSETILNQTYKNLNDKHHAYRKRLNEDFGSVDVYNKAQLLDAENFSVQSVENNLSVLILSYDSFRKKSKEYYKAFQQNGNLLKFQDKIKDDEVLDGADEFSLIQVIRHYEPIIIIDESHHAATPLSKEMLANFKPSFILELTATPRDKSNLIAYVSPESLKAEQMIKLPVQVLNFNDKKDVISGAIDKRNELENLAGGVIRPIVLFQAESKGKAEDRATFDKVKQDLIKLKIPAEEIAIKTAEINELKNINLNDKACKIKYIITINALAEDWDCPSAYILASLANRNSPVEIEQLLGRILRQPNTRYFDNDALNKSYVFTSSNDFNAAVNSIVKSLNNEGYEASDCSAFDEDGGAVQVKGQGEFKFENEDNGKAEIIQVRSFKIKEPFASQKIILPQFVIEYEDKRQANIFNERELNFRKLEPDMLHENFNLSAQDADVNFDSLDDLAAEIDFNDQDRLHVRYITPEEQHMSKIFDKFKNFEEQRRACIEILADDIDVKRNEFTKDDIRNYVARALTGLDDRKLMRAYIKHLSYANLINRKIDKLLSIHAREIFYNYAKLNKISTRLMYNFPAEIKVAKGSHLAKTLYAAEEDDSKTVNNFERKMAAALSGFENILWWHRNPASASNGGFYLNGFINHYPDFIARTKNNITLLIETKGDDRDNSDSKFKLDLGMEWEKLSGENYKYFMVFDDNDNFEHAINFNDFVSRLKSF